MTRFRKICIVICVLALLTGGLYFYWEQEISLMEQLFPQTWTTVQLHGYVSHARVSYAVDEAANKQILQLLEESRVTRGPSFETFDGDALTMWLYPDEGYTEIVSVRKDGRISVVPQLDGRKNHYYEGGEELYKALKAIAEDLPIQE